MFSAWSWSHGRTSRLRSVAGWQEAFQDILYVVDYPAPSGSSPHLPCPNTPAAGGRDSFQTWSGDPNDGAETKLQM